jgi:hypothetical protein
MEANEVAHELARFCFNDHVDNEVAHELARFCFNDHVDEFWDSGPPSFFTF